MEVHCVKKGFTLIELLIVVLIIAILAAIAVPNFLEFQVRAKVSRVKSDMRALVTGLEAYRVDNSAYPEGTWSIPALYRITTPIGYVSSLPDDTFVEVGNVPPAQKHAEFPKFMYAGGWRPGDTGWGLIVRDLKISKSELPPYVPETGALASHVPYVNDGSFSVRYELRSWGPDRELSASTPYDPTNGTVSYGDVCYFGPGNLGGGY